MPRASVALSASNNIISNNGSGIGVNTGRPRCGRAEIRSATTSPVFYNNLGVFESAGNNAVRNNGPKISGAITVIPME